MLTVNLRLASTIKRIEKHVKNARKLSKKNLENYLVFNPLAMERFRAVNSAIDLGEIIVA